MKKLLRPLNGALSIGAVMVLGYLADITLKHRRRKKNPGLFSRY